MATTADELANTMHFSTELEMIVDEESPPDGGYGWVCVGSCFMVNCLTWGVIAVCFLQVSGSITASFNRQIWELYLSQGLLVGFGIGLLYITSTAILSQWFERKRSLANSISSAGSGSGCACFTWAPEAMIERLSVT